MLDRKEIIERAYHECMTEMYAKAQPSVDYNQLLEDAKNGKIGKDERVYERYYLSQEEFKYILNKYKDAYNIKAYWDSDVEIVEKYIKEGGLKDKYVPSYKDENGNFHPGYKGYENVAPLKKRISNIISESEFYKNIQGESFDKGKLIEQLYEEVVTNTIDACKNFYKFDNEETSFDFSVALGPSPNSCAEAVIQYWAHQGVDIEIKERNPLLLWEMDEYGENFEEYMREDYGDDWEEQWNKKWEEEKYRKEL